MFPLAMAPLGTMANRLCGVTNFVVNISMPFTLPKTPWASIKSPILYGLKIMMSTPPAKLEREPCKARPTAKPAAAITAAKVVTSTPKREITIMIKNILSAQENRFNKNFWRDSSYLLLDITLRVPLMIFLTTHIPTI